MRTLAVLALTLLVVPATTVQAQEPGSPDRAWADERRNLTFTPTTDGFTAESARDSVLAHDEFEVTWSTASALLRWRYANLDPAGPYSSDVDVAFDSVVEFEDRDGDGRLSFGDHEVQRFSLRDVDGTFTWEPLVPEGFAAVARFPLTNETDRQDEVPPIAEDPAILAGAAIIRMYVVPAVTTVNAAEVRPTETKFDIELASFPSDRLDTLVAVETTLRSTRQLVGDGLTPGLESQEEPVHLFVDWASTVNVDGIPRAVGSTVLSDGVPVGGLHEVGVVFSYPIGERVIHDPTIGAMRTHGITEVIVELAAKGDWLVYGSAIGLVGLATFGPAAWRVKRGA